MVKTSLSASLLLNYQFNIVILLFLFNLRLCVSRPKIYSACSLVNLINVYINVIYKFTKRNISTKI